MSFGGAEFIWVFTAIILVLMLVLIGVRWLNQWLDRKNPNS